MNNNTTTLNVKENMKLSRSYTIPTENPQVEVLLGYNITVRRFAPQRYEGHGIKEVNEDEVDIEITSLELVSFGDGNDILPTLSKRAKEKYIKLLLEVEQRMID